MRKLTEFYIDGHWVAPFVPRDHEVIDPSTEKPCAIISLGSETDVASAVAAARRALPAWSKRTLSERTEFLERVHSLYTQRIEDMAQAISLEMGAPISLARSKQAAVGAYHIRNFLIALRDFSFEHPLSAASPDERILREPIGVCALITPWNWPMNQVTLKVIPALAVGCTVVLKPSEVAPLSSMLFAEILNAAGAPAGVFNLVNGDGATVGASLAAHDDVDMISFTGSTRAGVAVSKAAADSVKRVSLELGGKSPYIVFEDADIERAVTHCVSGIFENSGQSCNAPSRLLVQRSAYDQSLRIAKDVAERTQIGDSAADGSHMGPLVSETQFERVQELISVAIDEGAKLLAGGLGRPAGRNRGYFVRPTIFADVANDMKIAQDEVFGPVLTITPFDTEEEAITIANDTPYGLASYVQTRDLERAKRVARAMQSGMVQINGTPRAPGSPFGGYKRSGLGREGGVFGLEEFLEVKAVAGWPE